MDQKEPGYIRRPLGRSYRTQTGSNRPKLDSLFVISSGIPAVEKPKQKQTKARSINWLAIFLTVVAGLVITLTVYFAVFSSLGILHHTINKQSSGSARKPVPKPNFTTYFPAGLPPSLVANKTTVKYSLDSFGFPVTYQGKSGIYVSEQSAGADFSLKDFKSNLTRPADFSTPVGQAIQGTIGNNTITALYTSGQTLILINCSGNNFCPAQSQVVAQSMQPNNSSSLFKK